MSYPVTGGILLCVFAHLSSSLSGDKLNATDGDVLRLPRRHHANGRRSHQAPQLNCRGGSPGCRDKPSVVEGYNEASRHHEDEQVILAATRRADYYLEVGKDSGSSIGTSGQRRREGDDHSTGFPSLLDVLNAIYLFLALVGACCTCCCCCLLCLPKKDDKDDYELRTIVFRDPQGNERIFRFHPQDERATKDEPLP
ncbi:hypothetical protein MRX96_014039 [Rhipicephalus microplus]